MSKRIDRSSPPSYGPEPVLKRVELRFVVPLGIGLRPLGNKNASNSYNEYEISAVGTDRHGRSPVDRIEEFLSALDATLEQFREHG